MASKTRLQFYGHVRELSSLITAGRYRAETAVETLLVMWSRCYCPKLPYDGLTYSPKFAALAKAQDFVAWLFNQDLLDSAYWLSSAYANWVGVEHRSNLAMFFTPTSLTNRLLDDLKRSGVSFAEHSFLDPACGGAAFLAPIAQRMRLELKAKGETSKQILEQVGLRLFGTDLDSTLCRMSRHFLRMVLCEEIADAGFEPELRIAQANSLSDLDAVTATFDVVVCNPPYRKMPAEEVALYQASFASVIEAQPNIYGLFIALCLRLLKPRGIAALVTPTSFMSGQSFSKLRRYLMASSEILHIGVVADRSGVFIDVQQETAITLLRQRNPEQATETTPQVAVISKNGMLKSVGSCVLPHSGNAWPIPRTEGDAEILSLASMSNYSLADYGYLMRVGVWVWNRDKRRTFPTLSDAKKACASVSIPLLWSSDIPPGGEVRFSDTAKLNGEHSFAEVSSLNISSVIKRSAVLLQRVTSNNQTRRLVAAVVPTRLLTLYGGFIGENHTVILEANEDAAISPELLVQLIGSKPIDRYFRCISGATNVSVFELSQLPLPAPHHLKTALAKGLDIDVAVIWAFEQKA